MSTLTAGILVLLSIIAIIVLTSGLKLKAFIALFIVSVCLALATLPADKVVSTLKEGFGSTMASIGFLIIFGAMIGVILDKTGGTLSIAAYILSLTGPKRSSQALGITGFVTGLPIFCDSGFIILSGLAKSFSRKSGISLPFMATVLATSLYSVHCLIPPHPGALAAAGIFGVNAGNLIVAGIILAVPGALSAWFWSRRLTAKLRYSEPAPAGEEEFPLYDRKLPSPFMSFLPVVVPLLLITAKSLAGLFDEDGNGLAARVLRFPGEPVFALFAGVLLSLLLVPQKSIGVFNEYFTEAINKAGPILIVTAAGGMFGMVIKSTGVGEAAGQVLAGTGLGLFVPFLIAVILKTAQGSSTVAIITTAALVMPMAGMLGLDSEWGRLLTLLAMGAGSMMISHANDSYFWVVSNFSGIDMETTLKIYSTSTIVMGITVFIFVFLASLIVL